MIRRAISISILFVISLTSVAYGDTFYLSPNGNDGNNGRSIGTPWATLQHADDFLTSPGDTLYVLGGTYGNRQYLECLDNGAQGNPIVVMAYPGHEPIFSGPGSTGEYRFYVTRDWWVFDGLAIIGGGDAREARIIEVRGNHNVIKNCNIRGNDNENTGCMNVIRGLISSYNEVRNCILQYAGYPPDDSDGSVIALLRGHHWIIENNIIRNGAHDCVLLLGWPDPCTYNTIRNNIIDNAWGHGIGLGQASGNYTTLMYNLIEGNRIRSGSIRDYKQAIGITGCGNTVRKNYIYSPYYKGIVLHAYGTSIVNNNQIYNNTLCFGGKSGVQMSCNNLPETRMVNNYFANNIFYYFQQRPTEGWLDREILIYLHHSTTWWNIPDEMGGNIFKNCLIWHQSASDEIANIDPPGTAGARYNFNDLITSWPKVFIDCIGTNPQFASTSLDSLPLLPESPCIDAGIQVIDPLAQQGGWEQLGWAGDAPDIGAYEFGGENPAPIIVPRWATFSDIIDLDDLPISGNVK